MGLEDTMVLEASHTQPWYLYFSFKFLFLHPKLAAKISKTIFVRISINTISSRKLENMSKRFECYQEAVLKAGRRDKGLDFPEFLQILQRAFLHEHFAQSRHSIHRYLLF